MSVTMKDIAEASSVSRAIVSAVLNGHADELRIAMQTRKKVLAAAEKLGYCRNELARSIVTGHSRTLAFVTVGLMGLHTYTGRIQSGVLTAAGKYNYAVKLYRLGERPEELIKNLQEWKISGIIFHTVSAEKVQPVAEALPDIPLSLVNLQNPGNFDYGITTDDESGAFQLVRHLIKNGRKRILCIGGDSSEFSNARIRGYRRAVRSAGVAELPVEYPQSTDLLPRQIMARLSEIDRPDAIFGISDTFAMLAERAVFAMNLKLPDDVAVAGFGDLEMGQYMVVPLTTVHQDFEKMGFLATEKIICNIEEKRRTFGRNEFLKTMLMIRASTEPN